MPMLSVEQRELLSGSALLTPGNTYSHRSSNQKGNLLGLFAKSPRGWVFFCQPQIGDKIYKKIMLKRGIFFYFKNRVTCKRKLISTVFPFLQPYGSFFTLFSQHFNRDDEKPLGTFTRGFFFGNMLHMDCRNFRVWVFVVHRTDNAPYDN